MKKILALVVAFVLCFTAVAGCFTATAEDAAVPTITIEAPEVAPNGEVSIAVKGENMESVDSYLLTVVIPEGFTGISIPALDEVVEGGNGGDYVVKGNTVKTLNEIAALADKGLYADGEFNFVITATAPEAEGTYTPSAVVDAGNSDAQPVEVTVVAEAIVVKAPVVEPEEPEVQDVELTFQHTLSLQSNIQIAIVPTLTDEFKGCADVYAICKNQTFNLETNEWEEVVSDKIYAADNGYFYYDGLLAVEMNVPVETVIYGADAEGNVLYKSNVDTYSVLDYAAGRFAKSNVTEATRRLCADILVYGSMAQYYFDYNLDNIVAFTGDYETTYGTINIKDMVEEYATSTVPEMNSVRNNGTDGTFNLSNYLELTSCVAIGYAFPKTEVSSLDNVELVVNYNDTEYKVSKFDTYSVNNNYYSCVFRDVIAYDFNKTITASLWIDGVQASTTRTYSVESYCQSKYNGDENDETSALCLAIKKYGDSVVNYFG